MEKINNLLDRKIIQVKEIKNSKFNFSALQWNAMATCYVQPYKYPTIEEKYLGFDYRKKFITDEITFYNPDIACLEEVDEKDLPHFKSIFDEKEYTFISAKKNYGHDCVVLAARKSFEVVESIELSHLTIKGKKGNQVSLVTVLKDSKSGLYLIVTVSHFQAFPIFRWTRIRQAEELIAFVKELKTKYSEKLKRDDDIAVLVCGDLNDNPDTPPLARLTRDKKLPLNSVFSQEKFTVYRKYRLVFSIKVSYKGTVDHVLHSKELEVSSMVESPSDKVIGDQGLPIPLYPSDHISLYCEFSYCQ